MTAKEIIGIIVLCGIGCLLVEVIGLVIGYADNALEVAIDWLGLTAMTSALIVLWTWTDKRKKKQQ